MDPSYDNVEPLLSRSRVSGPVMEYVFRCPVTGFEATGTAAIPQYGSGVAGSDYGRAMAGAGAEMAAESAVGRLIPGADSVMLLAENIFRSRRARRKQAESAAASQREQEERPKAMLLEAFSMVSDKFTWDADTERWVSAGA